MLLNLNQYFTSDGDYIFFGRSVYEQQHLSSSINFAIHKIKLSTFTSGTVILRKKLKVCCNEQCIFILGVENWGLKIPFTVKA